MSQGSSQIYVDILPNTKKSKKEIKISCLRRRFAPKVTISQATDIHIIGVNKILTQKIINRLANYSDPFKNNFTIKVSAANEGSAWSIIEPIKERASGTRLIVIGPGDLTAKAAFQAFQFKEEFYNMSLVHPSQSYEDDEQTGFLEVMKPWLFAYHQLGTQAHLVDQHAIQTIEENFGEIIRLGALKKNIMLAEPAIRDSDLVVFSGKAFKERTFGAAGDYQLLGFEPEEMCQMAHYCGRSVKNNTTVFTTVISDKDREEYHIESIATAIWYYLQGHENRPQHTLFEKTQYIQYIVHTPIFEEKLIFHKSLDEGKWWMEIPFDLSDDKFKSLRWLPCSYEDFEVITSGELPPRLDNAITRYRHLIDL